MIDIHTHILPGIDDGSRDTVMSMVMLADERRQGTKRIMATPHFYADRMTIEDFLRHRDESLRSLQDAMAESAGGDAFDASVQAADGTGAPMQENAEDWPQLSCGAEVYFFPGMGRAEKLPALCMEGTDLLLLEMPFVQWDEQILWELEEILNRQKLRILLAHVERYPEFQKDKYIWDEVMEMAGRGQLHLQVNAGSFLKHRAKRKFCLRLLQEYDNVVLGSDCHNTSSRPVNLELAQTVIRKKLGETRLRQMEQTAERLLGGEI